MKSKKSEANSTARVDWKFGQALLPAHFYAQESSLREELFARFSMRTAPSWGLFHLKWDEAQLERGAVAIEELALVLPSGILLDVPGNATAVRLNLAATKLTRASIYVHLQSEPRTVRLRDDGDGSDDDVDLIVQSLDVSVRPGTETAADSFKLAELELSGARWSISPAYIPPSLQVAGPFFDGILARCRSVCGLFKQAIAEELKADFLAAERHSTANQAFRGLYQFLGLLSDLGEDDTAVHPLSFFRALRSLYVEVCLFRRVDPTLAESSYRHDEIADSLDPLLAEAERLLHGTSPSIPYVEFQLRQGLRVCTLPPLPAGGEQGGVSLPDNRARDVFLLVQKPHVATPVRMAGVKLASPSRIDSVHDRALRGIPFEHLEGPPFFHGLSPNVDFYALSPGQEWDYAVNEGAIAFLDAPQLSELRFFLYVREK